MPLPLLVAHLVSESPACDLSANVFRDPHINFAHGGSADLRGQHGALYNFLSAPGLSVNVKIEETIFTLHQGSLTVNGTFLTEAHLVARMSPQKHATASFWASELDPNNFGWQTVNGTCVGRPFRFGNRGHKNCFGLEIAMQYSSAKFHMGDWTVTVRCLCLATTPRYPSPNARVPAFTTQAHLRHMRSCEGCLVKGPAHRLDVSFSTRGGTAFRGRPHGVIGPRLALLPPNLAIRC